MARVAVSGWKYFMPIMAAILFAVASLAARAENLPDQRPMLRIYPGMHIAPISIGVDVACSLMVPSTRQ